MIPEPFSPYDTGYNAGAGLQRSPPSRLDQLTKGHVERERQVASALERATSAFEAEKKSYSDDWKKQLDNMRTKSTSMERERAKRAEGDETARKALADRTVKSYESFTTRSETEFEAATTRALEDLAGCIPVGRSQHGTTTRTSGRIDQTRPSQAFAKVLDTLRVELQLPKQEFPGVDSTRSGAGANFGLSPSARGNSQSSSCVLLDPHSSDGNIKSDIGVQMHALATCDDHQAFLDSSVQRWAQHLEDERAGFSKVFSSFLRSVNYQSLGDVPEGALAAALSEFRAAERMRNAEAAAEFKRIAFSSELNATRVLNGLRRAEWKIIDKLRPAPITSSESPSAGNAVGIQIRPPREPSETRGGPIPPFGIPPPTIIPTIGEYIHPPTLIPVTVPDADCIFPPSRTWSREVVHVDVHPATAPIPPSIPVGVYHHPNVAVIDVPLPPTCLSRDTPSPEDRAHAQESSAEPVDEAAVAFRELRRQHEFNLMLASWKRNVRTDAAEREAAYAGAQHKAREEWLAEERARDKQFGELADRMNEIFTEANDARGKAFVGALRKTSDAFHCALDEAMFGMHQFLYEHRGSETTDG